MIRKFLAFHFFAVVLLACGSFLKASQQPTDQESQSAVSQLKDRAHQFYQDILKGDRVAALELVAPESKNRFLNSSYDGLTDFQIASVELAKSGDLATVRVNRIVRVPNFQQPLQLNVIETWRLSNGQWYYTLPPPGEFDSPFGKIKLDPNSTPSAAEAQEMLQRVEKAYKNVDADEYIQALQKVAPASGTESKKSDKPSETVGAAAKPDDKQTTKPAPSTPPQGDTSKPQQ